MEEIKYITDGLDEEEIIKRKKAFERWYKLVMESYIKFTKKSTIELANLEELFTMVLGKVFEIPNFKESINKNNFGDSLYLSLLMRENKEAGIDGIFADNVFSLDECYFYLALLYYNCDSKEIANFLVNYDEEAKKILRNWLKEQARYGTCNYLLRALLTCIKNVDSYFYENFSDILKVMNQVNCDLFRNNLFYGFSLEEINLPNLSKDELNSLIKGFLASIKAPKEWYQGYVTLKEAGKIIMQEGETSFRNNSFYNNETGIITIDYRGNISDFPTLIHELGHYFSAKNNKDVFLIDELPSIYLEKLAILYLENIGYDKTVVDFLKNQRTVSNFFAYQSLFEVLMLIDRYKKNGAITKERLMQAFLYANEELKKIQAEMIKIALRNGKEITDALTEDYSVNPEEAANAQIDQEIDSILRNQGLVLDGCQHIIDTIIVQELLKRPQDEVLSKMIEITGNLSSFDLERVIREFNIQVFKNDENPERKLKK